MVDTPVVTDGHIVSSRRPQIYQTICGIYRCIRKEIVPVDQIQRVATEANTAATLFYLAVIRLRSLISCYFRDFSHR